MELKQTGLERMKLDLLFILSGSVKIKKDFSYEQQRDYYLEKIFPNDYSAGDIIEFGRRYKKVSEYMFPNTPANVRNKKFLAEVLADCALLNQMYLAEDFATMINEAYIHAACFNECPISDADAETGFAQEIGRRHHQYSLDLDENDRQKFKALMETFTVPFMKIFDKVKAVLCKKQSSSEVSSTVKQPSSQESSSPVKQSPSEISSLAKQPQPQESSSTKKQPPSLKTDTFSVLCKKLGVAQNDEFIFRLKLNALSEIQIGNNAYVGFFDSFKEDWHEKFPRYQYCDELENYIRQEKSGCVAAYGNKTSSLRNEMILFDLLVEVELKLVLSDGVLNLDELNKSLEQKFEHFPHEDLRKILDERKNRIMRYYSLNRPENYGVNFKSEFVPYRAGLLYVDEILKEEISRRYKISAKQPMSSDPELKKRYELLLSQKDAEIDDLKRDLEYYENIKSQEFRSDFSKYDEALTTLFDRLCEYKFGAPLGELYRMANGDTDIKADDLKTVMKNFLFVFNTLGITPYDTKNLGKKLRFDSEDANVVYSVNEKDVVEGLNTGTLKYPGWKYAEKKMVLPLIIVDKEET